MPLTFPWGKGLTRRRRSRRSGTTTKFPDGTRFYDYEHAETGAPILKAQHPEFELWSQGIHARSGVACADCHMPYMREGATQGQRPLGAQPAAQRQPRLPDLPPLLRGRDEGARRRRSSSATTSCCSAAARRIVELIDAIVAAQGGGRDAPSSSRRRSTLQRKAQWRLDFIAAENSMGFHAPQEAARVLGEAIDYARQGQIAAMRWKTDGKAQSESP